MTSNGCKVPVTTKPVAEPETKETSMHKQTKQISESSIQKQQNTIRRQKWRRCSAAQKQSLKTKTGHNRFCLFFFFYEKKFFPFFFVFLNRTDENSCHRAQHKSTFLMQASTEFFCSKFFHFLSIPRRKKNVGSQCNISPQL